MTITIHGSILPGGATALMLEPFPDPQTLSVDGRQYTCGTIAWQVRVPDSVDLIPDSRGMLSLQIGDRSYSANHLFALADLKLGGFRSEGR